MPFLFQASGVSHIWYNDPITIATVVIAVCTIFYSLFTFLLLKATVQNTEDYKCYIRCCSQAIYRHTEH